MTLKYMDLMGNERQLISLTSLTRLEFEKLLPMFEKAWDDKVANDIERKGGRQRAYGGGRKPVLDRIEDKLLFILVYTKTYPLQTVMGVMFGISQSQANFWIHKLSGVLRTALAENGFLPERESVILKSSLAEGNENELAIDGTERRIQRPKDTKRQEMYYSGKKNRIQLKTT